MLENAPGKVNEETFKAVSTHITDYRQACEIKVAHRRAFNT